MIIYDKEKIDNPNLKLSEFVYYFSPFRIVINNSVIIYSAGMGGDIFFINKIDKQDANLFIYGDSLNNSLNKNDKMVIILKKDGKINLEGWGFSFNNLIKLKDYKIIDSVSSLVQKGNSPDLHDTLK